MVRVYERPDVDGIFMTRAWELTPSGRPQETPLPEGITREAAEILARKTAAAREENILRGRDDFGVDVNEVVTVARLFEAYRDSETAAPWSKKHRADVERSLTFWEAHVGAENVLTLVPERVEKIAGDAGRKMGVSPRWVRKRIKHIRAAVRWGKRKARLYDRDPLDGVSLPRYEPDTDDLIYTAAETSALLRSHERIDWRVTLLANIAADTGRRLNATLSLTASDVVTDGERVFLRFRGEFDKGGKASVVPVSAPTAALLADALDHDLVIEWGWLFPEGRLDYDDARDKPWGDTAAIEGLHHAEDVLGIPYVKGRAYHGIKRRHVTTAMEVTGGDTALVGDQTGNVSAELIRRVYRKQNRSRQATHVDAVRAALEGETGRESTRESTRDGDDE